MKDERKNQAERLVADLLSLSKFPRRPLPDDFEAALHRRLVEAATAHPRPRQENGLRRMMRPLFIAGAFAVVFLFGLMIGRSLPAPRDIEPEQTPLADRNAPTPAPAVAAKTVVQRGEPVTIRLVYESARDIEQVHFTIVLDEGVRFRASDPDIAARHELAWEGSLVAGRNEIPIVVTVDEAGERTIRAHARFNGTTLEQVVTLIAKEDSHA